MRRKVRVAATAAAASLLAVVAGANPSGAGPTCSATLGIAVHGQHVVSDYVAGTHVDWPPSGGVVGAAGGGAGGAALPGGPGPGFHFPNGFAPGASFCLPQSHSPGAHPGGG